MAIIIKEIRVNTIVEKRVIQDYEISEDVYKRIKSEVLARLSKPQKTGVIERKNER